MRKGSVDKRCVVNPGQAQGLSVLTTCGTRACLPGGGVPPTQVAEWAGHSLEVLLRIYAKCLVGQNELAKRRIIEALRQDQPPGHTEGTASRISPH